MRWASSWCWCTASGRRSTSSCGPRARRRASRTACASPTSVALDCAQEAAGQLRFEIEAAFSQGLPNTPMANAAVRVISGNFLTARPVGIVDGVDFSTPAGAQGRRGRHAACDRRRRHGAAVAVRLFAHRRGVQPDDGRRGHQRRHRAAGRQADLPDRGAGHPREARRSRIEHHRHRAGAGRRPAPAGALPEPTQADRHRLLPAALRARPAKAASSARTSCRSPPTARCCWRCSRTTASAPWSSTRSSKACARRPRRRRRHPAADRAVRERRHAGQARAAPRSNATSATTP